MTIKIIIKRDLTVRLGIPYIKKVADLYVGGELHKRFLYADNTSFRVVENRILKYCKTNNIINDLFQTSYECEYRK